MRTERLAAFSDGVLAIVITIMVLEMKPPHGADLATLAKVAPVFVSYILSFLYIAIYWNNHHHLLHTLSRVDGGVMWANMHLLFWLSLFPFSTAWMGENQLAPLPTAVYGVVLLLAAIAYYLLQAVILRHEGPDAKLARALGRDIKGKVSPLIYLIAIPLAFASPLAANVLYYAVALMWLVPDRRIEKMMGGS